MVNTICFPADIAFGMLREVRVEYYIFYFFIFIKEYSIVILKAFTYETSLIHEASRCINPVRMH